MAFREQVQNNGHSAWCIAHSCRVGTHHDLGGVIRAAHHTDQRTLIAIEVVAAYNVRHEEISFEQSNALLDNVQQ